MPPPPAKGKRVRVCLASCEHFQRMPPGPHHGGPPGAATRLWLHPGSGRGGGGPKTSGLNEQVRAQIGANPHYQRLLNQLYDCIHTMAMNLSEIHVAIGCKWGKHRSVAMVEDLGTSLYDLAFTFDCMS